MYTRLGKTAVVSHGQTVLRFGFEPFEMRFNSDGRALNRPVQAFVSGLGADARHAPTLPTENEAPR